MKLISHAAESLHWYSRDGSPAYQVEAAKGGMRPTTLRDARKLGLVPSVTSVIRSAAAPGLERWKQEQVLLAALTLPRNSDEPESAWLNRMMTDSKEQGRKAAERGTAIHAAIQGHYEGEAPSPEFWPHVSAAKEAIAEHFKMYQAKWIPEKSFAHQLGFGGKTDLHCPEVVLDFKTKEFKEDDDLKTWDEHAMQLAAYRVGLNIPNARCAIVYVSASVPGLARVLEIKEDELAKGWSMFRGLLTYWQAKSGYVSAWEEAVAA